MVQSLYYLLKEARPRQWVKNLIIFFAIFFTGELFNAPVFWKSVGAFLIFCAVSSSVYFINDLSDIEKDRQHPFKKFRPLASGKISKSLVLIATLILSISSLFFAMQISQGFFAIVIGYYILQLSYSFFLKNISLIDILAISLGFIMRVIAGETATGFHISVWLLLAIISGSLFLTIGKRRSELTLLSGWQGAIPAKTRAVLLHYSEKMLDVYLSMFANATWITYAFYSFLQPAPKLRTTFGNLFDAYQLDILTDRKWIMLTIPVTIYGVMRYLQLIYEKNVGESPEKILLSDKPLIITTLIFTMMIFFVIYVVGK